MSYELRDVIKYFNIRISALCTIKREPSLAKPSLCPPTLHYIYIYIYMCGEICPQGRLLLVGGFAAHLFCLGAGLHRFLPRFRYLRIQNY